MSLGVMFAVFLRKRKILVRCSRPNAASRLHLVLMARYHEMENSSYGNNIDTDRAVLGDASDFC